MRKVIAAFEESHDLLRHGNNDRVTWIAAARIIEKAQKIEADVTHATHRDVMEIQEYRYRRMFGDVLGHDNPGIRAGLF